MLNISWVYHYRNDVTDGPESTLRGLRAQDVAVTTMPWVEVGERFDAERVLERIKQSGCNWVVLHNTRHATLKELKEVTAGYINGKLLNRETASVMSTFFQNVVLKTLNS